MPLNFHDLAKVEGCKEPKLSRRELFTRGIEQTIDHHPGKVAFGLMAGMSFINTCRTTIKEKMDETAHFHGMMEQRVQTLCRELPERIRQNIQSIQIDADTDVHRYNFSSRLILCIELPESRVSHGDLSALLNLLQEHYGVQRLLVEDTSHIDHLHGSKSMRGRSALLVSKDLGLKRDKNIPEGVSRQRWDMLRVAWEGSDCVSSDQCLLDSKILTAVLLPAGKDRNLNKQMPLTNIVPKWNGIHSRSDFWQELRYSRTMRLPDYGKQMSLIRIRIPQQAGDDFAVD